jgi:hypothetical protein
MSDGAYYDFLVEYPFDGAMWGLTISARTQDEAVARIKQMPWATVKGRVVMKVPLKEGGFFGQLFKAFLKRRGYR